MYYLRNRYYNPQLQRFINADNLTGSIGVVNSHNVFAYCFNNPIGYVDCEVKWPSLSGILTAVAVVAAVVTVGALCVAAVAAAPLAVATSTGIILTTTGSASVIANAMTTAAIAGKIPAAVGAAIWRGFIAKRYGGDSAHSLRHGILARIARTGDAQERA